MLKLFGDRRGLEVSACTLKAVSLEFNSRPGQISTKSYFFNLGVGTCECSMVFLRGNYIRDMSINKGFV